MTESTPDLASIIDLEASGFGSSSYPIEVGIVLPNGQTYCSLIVPEPDWRHSSAFAISGDHSGRVRIAQSPASRFES